MFLPIRETMSAPQTDNTVKRPYINKKIKPNHNNFVFFSSYGCKWTQQSRSARDDSDLLGLEKETALNILFCNRRWKKIVIFFSRILGILISGGSADAAYIEM